MTADIRCVFTASPHLFAVDLWKRLAVTSPTHLQLSSHSHWAPLSKRAAAALCLLLVFFFMLRRILSVISLFGSCVHRCVRSHAWRFFFFSMGCLLKGLPGTLRPPAQTRCWAIRGVFKVHTVNNPTTNLPPTRHNNCSHSASASCLQTPLYIFLLHDLYKRSHSKHRG